MIDYNNIDKKLKQKLIDICAKDPYNLSPKELYYNIYNSTGDFEELSKIFEVPLWVIVYIKT